MDKDENIIRVRKVIRKKARFVLPKIKAIYSQQTIDYTEKETQTWIDSLSGKSAEQITDAIFVESW